MLKRRLILLVDLLICLIVLCVVFRLLPFELNTLSACYSFTDRPGRCIDVYVPRFGFNYQTYDETQTISYFRGMRALTKEIKAIQSEYNRLKCDGVLYYYEIDNYFIYDLKITKGLLINQYSYRFTFDLSCDDEKTP